MARALLALLVAVFVTAMPARAADIRLGPIHPSRPNSPLMGIWLKGKIEAGDAARFEELMQEAKQRGGFVTNLYLDSPGGSLAEGIRLGHAIKRHLVQTTLLSRSICASACILAFAASRYRIVYRGAYIGVHGASDDGLETTEAMAGTLRMARLASQLGVPDSIVTKIITTPPHQMHWLGPEDVKALAGNGAFDRENFGN